jgi:hypothetical protein
MLFIIRPKQNICLFPVTCPNTKVRVGRSAFFSFFFFVVAKRDFAQKMVNKCKNSVFWVIFVKKNKKLLWSGLRFVHLENGHFASTT